MLQSPAIKALRRIFSEMFEDYDPIELQAGSIISLLTRRFRRVPKSIQDKINSITDIDRLDWLDDQALYSCTPKEFIKALNNGECCVLLQ